MSARPTELPPPGAADVIYIIDVSGYVFRAYHALEPLTNSKGEITHATYGTLNMIAKLLRERKPVRLGVAMEGGNSLRVGIDPRYKATRPPHPPDLEHQLVRTRQIVEGYRIPILMAAGYEADDVIAAVVTRAKAAKFRVVISSADKDLLQLVDDKCCMWDTMRDRVYGPPEVVHKFGVGPDKVRDLLAMVGDTSDNIPGVPGIGEKTAAALLTQFPSLEAIYENIDKVSKPRIKQNLIEFKKDALLSQDLVTLRADAPIDFDPEALRYEGADTERLHELFTELEFTRYLTNMPRSIKAKPDNVVAEYKAALTIADLEAVAVEAKKQKLLAVTALTSAEGAMRADIVGIGLGVLPGKAVYVPLAHRYLGAPKQLSFDDVRAALGSIFADPAIEKIGYDVKETEVVFAERGAVVRPFGYDVMLASYLLDPELPNALAEVAERDGGIAVKKLEDVVPKRKGKPAILEDATVEEATLYGAAFADVAVRLRDRHLARMREAGVEKVLTDLEMPISEVLSDLERGGVLVDPSVLGTIGESMTKALVALEQKAREVSGHPDLNVGSPRQLETILFDELGLRSTKKTKTGRSTDAEALEAIADNHDLPQVILDHRAIAKLKGTYVDALPRLIHPKTGRIHGHWRQAVAATGRISSEDPNLQNIPTRTELGKEIRRAFVAPPGSVFLSADYSQIELRVLAHLSQDPAMLDAFRSGQDIHTRTAIEVFGVAESEVTSEMRRRCKAINFGIIYGMGENALAKRIGIARSEAGQFIEAYFKRYGGVATYMKKTLEEARKTERVRTILGRIRILPDLRNSDRMKRSYAERIAQNTPIQGSAADILKLAMIRLRAPIMPGVKMVLTVHDELDFEVPVAIAEEAGQKIRAAMENVVALDVPLVVDVAYGRSWADAH